MNNRRTSRSKIVNLLKDSLPARETAIMVLSNMGRNSKEDDLCDVLEVLLQQLGSSSAPLRSLAYTEVRALTRER